MVKYGEFIIIIDKNHGGMFNNLYYNVFGSSDDELYYKYNSDIIYTFYDNPEQSYSQREIYTAKNDYENKYFYFSRNYDIYIHPIKIINSIFSMTLQIEKYDSITRSNRINFKEIFDDSPIDKNTYKLIDSIYNCVYKYNLTEKNIFSIVKYESSNMFPRFMFYYDYTILNKKDVIYLIKKIIDIDFY
jgi:hypothetical protein